MRREGQRHLPRGYALLLLPLLTGCGGGGGGGPAASSPMQPPPPTQVLPPLGMPPVPVVTDAAPLPEAEMACPDGHYSSLCAGAPNNGGSVTGFSEFMTRAEAQPNAPVLARILDGGFCPDSTLANCHGEQVMRALATASRSGGRVQTRFARGSAGIRNDLNVRFRTYTDFREFFQDGVVVITNPVDDEFNAAAHAPPNTVVFVAAGNLGPQGADNARMLSSTDLGASGRWVVVAGSSPTPDSRGLHEGSVSCSPVESWCLTAPFTLHRWPSSFRGTDGNPVSPEETLQGTSFSTPIVAGVAATIWGLWPTELTAEEIPRLLYQCAEGGSADLGHGHLNLRCLLAPADGLELPNGYSTTGLAFAGALSLPHGARLTTGSAVVGRDRFGRSFRIRVPYRNDADWSFAREFAAFAQDFAAAGAPATDCPDISFGDGFAGRRFRASVPAGACAPARFFSWGQATRGESLLLAYGTRLVLRERTWLSLIVGAAANRGSAHGGSIVGNGQLRVGDGWDALAGALLTRAFTRRFGVSAGIGVVRSEQLRPAGGSAIRGLRAGNGAAHIGASWQSGDLSLSAMLTRESGLAGSMNLGGRRVRFDGSGDSRADLRLELRF